MLKKLLFLQVLLKRHLCPRNSRQSRTRLLGFELRWMLGIKRWPNLKPVAKSRAEPKFKAKVAEEAKARAEVDA